MKTKLPIIAGLALAFTLLFVGCNGRLVSPVYAPQPPGSTNAPVIIGYLPSTNAISGAQTAQAIGQALPPPWNWAVGGAASLFTVGLSLFAKKKTDLAVLNGNKAAQAQDIINAAITAIEAASKTNPAVREVKATIASHVAAAGYGEDFDKQVQDISNKL